MFRVGQKVVCVDDLPPPGFDGQDMLIRRGVIYTVREVGLPSWMDGTECIRLSEVRQANDDTPYWARRFRPIVDRPTDISVFKEMLHPSKIAEACDV
jgi:hypothetical protein